MAPEGRRRISSTPGTLRVTRSTSMATGKSPGATGACHACCTGSIAKTEPVMPSTTARVPTVRPSQRWMTFQLMQVPSLKLEGHRLDVLLAGLRLADVRFGQRDADLRRAVPHVFHSGAFRIGQVRRQVGAVAAVVLELGGQRERAAVGKGGKGQRAGGGQNGHQGFGHGDAPVGKGDYSIWPRGAVPGVNKGDGTATPSGCGGRVCRAAPSSPRSRSRARWCLSCFIFNTFRVSGSIFALKLRPWASVPRIS